MAWQPRRKYDWRRAWKTAGCDLREYMTDLDPGAVEFRRSAASNFCGAAAVVGLFYGVAVSDAVAHLQPTPSVQW
jgi:hypothetical protein